MIKDWEDDELGRLCVRVHPRAKRFIFRTKSDAIYITVPPGVTFMEIKRVLEDFRPKLLLSRRRVERPLVDYDYHIHTDFYRLSLVAGTGTSFMVHSQTGSLQLICPRNVNFADENLQGWLHKVIVESLKSNAKKILPFRLARLSEETGLSYTQVKINASKGRWGSCSVARSINLSCFLLLLPSHLVDYVLLHELCHTREMNHGERFWALLNQFTEGKALALREELKKFHTEF